MTNDPSSASPSGRFPTTAWGFIQAVQDGRHAEDETAINQFVAAYWKPVFCFLRARGYPVAEAEDLTQEFFLRILQRDWLRTADPRRGRFRTFLLTLLVRFLSDQGPRRAPRQKRFERQIASIEGLIGAAERSYEPPAGQTPEAIFMRQWAAALVGQVLQRLRRSCAEDGRTIWYEVFAALRLGASQDDPDSQHALAERFGVTRDQVRYALKQAQERFVGLLRAEVRDQNGSEADVGEEIRELMALLGD